MKQRVLFLCTGNSARSQMAEGWLRHLAGERYDVVSAGTHPAGLHPGAVEAMLECGVDISTHHSKAVTELTSQVFDYVITVCDRAKDACPVWPDGATVLHWSVEDPASVTPPDEGRSLFRTVRDGIRGLVEEFLRSVSTAR